jgi:hypothetical protein
VKYLLVARLRSYINQPADEFVWEFPTYAEALRVHQLWTDWMADGLWQFVAWGLDDDMHLIKPGAVSELDLRTVSDRR